ncbi:MAG: hypothetical protein MJZ64_06465 [Paludibacteraceae bacterium]|nr:hypothetical protein [Paludibacteraceae bacterium]
MSYKSAYPIEELHGKLSSHRDGGNRIPVTRQKTFGHDAKGNPIQGPKEFYPYHIHEGAWSPNVVAARALFAQAQRQARAELADAERYAYWQNLFEEQLNHPQPGQKRYSTLLGFVSTQIQSQLRQS